VVSATLGLFDCSYLYFLYSSFFPSFAMILIMQEDYINTSHPNFIGGSKAVEQAQQQVRSARMSATVVKKVCIYCYGMIHLFFFEAGMIHLSVWHRNQLML
jgi:hypothetical protein